MNFLLLTWERNKWFFSCFLLVIFSINSVTTKAGNTIDSLINVVSNAENDTNKVKLLFQICNAYYPTEYEKAIAYSYESFLLAKELHYVHGQMNASTKLGKIYKNIGEFDSAIYYIEQALNYAETIGHKIQQIKNLNLYGSLLRRKGYYSTALEIHKKGLALSYQIDDKLGIANSSIYMAIIHEMKMNYDTAITYYYKSLRIFEELENNRNVGVTLLNIGDMYISLLDYKKAKENFKKALILFEELKDTRYIGLSNNKIGIVFSEAGNYDSALYHYQICEIYYDSIENKSGLAHVNINKGNLYLNWGIYDSAYYYFNKAKDTFEKIDFKRGYLNALLSLSDYYTKIGQTNNAIEYYNKCEEIASIVSPYSLLNVYLGVLNIYKNADDFKQAFEYQTKYYELNDSIFNIEKTKMIADLTLKYEKEKDQARILHLENENLTKDLNLRKRTNQRNIYLFSGIGIVVLILFLFIFYHQKSIKDNVIANQKIKQLEEEKKLLAAKFLVEGQEEERKRIAKELHDGLGVLLSTAKMQFTNIKDKSPKNKLLIEKATQLLEQATGDVRRISHNLMPGLLTRFGLYEAAEDLIEQVDETQGLAATCEIKGDTNRLPENTEIMLYRIIQELVNNTIKHAKASIITLKMDIFPESIKINYTDNGVGFDLEEKLKLKSIGLNSIQSRVSFLGGELRIEAETGKGVSFELLTPIA